MVQPGAQEFRGTERFQLLSRIGEGGMGVVYKALDRDLNAKVALKTMRMLSGEAVLRFKNEFRALQDLQHRNLISLGELICDGGQWFFTMELVDGIDFRAWVRGTEDGPDDFAIGGTTEDSRLESATDVGTTPGTPSRRLWDPTQATARFDEGRLRAAAGQLAEGLHALHGAGKVHRDIKPSNILVTFDGRVVLLDFGLATDVAAREMSDPQAVGTVDYMAPEQAAAKQVGPEADWYAMGALLFESLTGRLPFVGAPLQVMMDKQRVEPPSPRELVPEVPEDLDRLCAELLRFEPGARPSGVEVLRRLGVEAARRRSSPGTTPFVGRKEELAAIRAAFEESRERAVAVLVQGESGVGKSALVRRFTDGIQGDIRGPVVLAGRCYERESVPYKAFDGVIDALSRYLSRLDRGEAAALVPRHAALLAQVFPVMRRVEGVAQAAIVSEVIDPIELRTRVFTALREILKRLAERRPLVLVIDDLQWADVDSLSLLARVMRPVPDPAPPLLLVATVSGAAEPEGAGYGELAGAARRLPLARLAPAEAREMVAGLLGEAVGASAVAIAEEAGGHPLFIDELVRHVAAGHAPGPILLEEALWARIARLDEGARAVLELVAVAGTPLTQEVIARAAHAAGAAEDFSAFARLVSTLRAAHLVRTGGARGSDAIEPYHDRVREAVLWHLDEGGRRSGHQRLALALEAAPRADAEALSAHWRGAGDTAKAARYASVAAGQAAEAFAFVRAAKLYRLSLELAAPGGAEERALRAKMGDALANAGRGAEAAKAYWDASEGAEAAEALALRGKVADQLLRSGHIDEGLQALGAVLDAIGMKMPQTPRAALTSLLYHRAKLRLRGLGYRERDGSEVAPTDLARADIAWAVAQGLGMVDPIRGADFQTRSLLLSLSAGEPLRVARALALEGAFVASGGGRSRRRSARLLARSEVVAQRLDHPQLHGMHAAMSGIAAYLLGEWGKARDLCVRAETIFRERCTGVQWEVQTAYLYRAAALYWLGEVGELKRMVPARIREAMDRGDLYGATTVRHGLASMAWLASGDTARARSEADEATRQWSRSGFHLQHYSNMWSHAHTDLYVGEAASALRRLEEGLPEMKRAMMMRVQILRTEAADLHGRCALARAMEVKGSEQAALVATVERCAKGIEGEGMAWARPLATMLRAGAAHVRGQRTEAVARLRRAEEGFVAAEMALHAAVARRRGGELEGGEGGRARVVAADEWMRGQEIVAPERIAQVLAPGLC